MSALQKTEIIKQLDAVIAECSGSIGLAAKNLATGETLGIRDAEVSPTASMIKMCILVEVFRQRDAGLLSLDDRLTMRAEDQVGGSGHLKSLHPGLPLRVRDLCYFMMPPSDNTATNMLIDLVGVENVNGSIRSTGMASTELRHRIDFRFLLADPTHLGVGSPRDFCLLMEKLVTESILTPQSCQEMLDTMKDQQTFSFFWHYLPYNPYAADLDPGQKMWIAGKAGGMTGIRTFTAAVGMPHVTYVVSLMAKDGTDARWNGDDDQSTAIGRLSRALYEYWA